MMKGAVFATPTIDFHVTTDFLRSFSETQTLLTQHGIMMYHIMLGGNTFVAMARNALVADYLNDPNLREFDDFFFLDDDIGWPAQKIMEFIHRDEDIVAGVYPKKNDNDEFPCELTLKDGCFIERNGLVKAEMAPTGFMRIKRHVLQKMSDAAPAYMEEVLASAPQERRNIFKAGFIDSVGWRGEDYQFCMEWVGTYGGEIWVDPNIDFTHRGGKKWSGNLYRKMLAMIEEQRQRETHETHGQLGLSEAAE